MAVVNWRDPWHSAAGGAEAYAWQAARALVDAGARVDFVTARDKGQTAVDTVDGVHVVRGGGRFGYYAWALWWLLRHRSTLAAVVDADCGIPQFSPWVLHRGTPVVLVVHHIHRDQFGTYFPEPLAALGRFLEGSVMPRAYRRATTVAVSESTRREMVERLGWRGPVDILHNGSDSLVVRVGPTRTGSQDDRIAVLGRLAPHKRVDEVIRAAASLVDVRPGLRVDVIGKGSELDELAALVRELGLDERVVLHGYVGEATKAELLGAARIHVCASDGEGWGQVVLEAAAAGVPTLARAVPGLVDSVRPGLTGWLLADGGVAGSDLAGLLASGIDTALAEMADPARRQDVDEACRAWAARYTWIAMREGLVGLVERALGESSGGVDPAL